MGEHPTPETLKSFLLGRLPAKEVRQVVLHLIRDCPRCLGAMRPLSTALFRPGAARETPEQEGERYSRAITSALNAALEREELLRRERQEAEAKIIQLLSTEGPRSSEFWTWGLCEALQRKSWALRQADPAGMLQLASLAVETAQRLEPGRYGAAHVADLLAQAWSELANAYRISDQLHAAEAALSQAFKVLREGTGSPLLRARLAELTASLLCDQRHFPMAFRLLDTAHRLYLRQSAGHEAGRTLIIKGLHTGYTGDPEEGVRLLACGLRLIDRSRDSKLVFQVLHNILLFRVELGEFRLARHQLWEMRPLYRHHTDQIALVKLRWIEGKIFVGLGKREYAIRAFLQAKESFEREGLAYDAALVSFDLAAVWLQEGKRKEVRQLIHEMLETFRARYIAREAIASLLMLRDAADRGALSLDLLDMVAGFFRSLKDEPKALDPGEMQ
jgi:tetratricopeptide (TPR) repeat protein